MEDQEIWKTLEGVFLEIFNLEEVSLSPETSAADIQGWDSLSHINFILRVEEVFSVKFKGFEVVSFENVGDLVETIKKKKT